MSSSRRDNIAVRDGKKIKRQFEKDGHKQRRPQPTAPHTPSIFPTQEDKFANLVFSPDQIDSEGFDALVGIDDVKINIQTNFVMPIVAEKLGRTDFFAPGIKIRKHMMLYGPPGTGKTQIAKAMAKELDFVFYLVTLEQIREMGGRKGTGEGVHAIFKHARKQGKPAFIFIDEGDEVIARKGIKGEFGGDVAAKNALLTEMEGVFSTTDNVHVVIATNYPDRIEGAFVSRAQPIEVPRPERFARKKMLQRQFELLRAGGRTTIDLDLDIMAAETEGYTGRELELVAAKMNDRQLAELEIDLDVNSLLSTMKKFKSKPIIMDDFYYAKDRVLPRYNTEIETSIENFKAQNDIEE